MWGGGREVLEGGNQTNIPKIQEQLKHWFQLKKKMNWNNICMRVGTKAELPCYRNLFIPPPQPTVNPLPLVIVADFRLFCGEGDQGGGKEEEEEDHLQEDPHLFGIFFFPRGAQPIDSGRLHPSTPNGVDPSMDGVEEIIDG